MVANLLKKGLQDSCAFWVQCFILTTRWQRCHCAVRGLDSGWWEPSSIIYFQSEGGWRQKKVSVDPNEPGAVLDCLGSSAFFLSTRSEIQRLQSSGARRGGSPCPFGQTCRGAMVLSAVGPLCWCQSLVLEVIFQRLGQGEALDLLKPIPTQRQAGRSPAQVHEREGFS